MLDSNPESVLPLDSCSRLKEQEKGNLSSSTKADLKDTKQGAQNAVAGACWTGRKERSCRVRLGYPCRVGLCRSHWGIFARKPAGEYCVRGTAAWSHSILTARYPPKLPGALGKDPTHSVEMVET